MTKTEAEQIVRGYGEDEGPESGAEVVELFSALYGRRPDADDEAAGVWSLCCAAIDAAPATRLIPWREVDVWSLRGRTEAELLERGSDEHVRALIEYWQTGGIVDCYLCEPTGDADADSVVGPGTDEIDWTGLAGSIKWNETQDGNAHVSDGAVGFWANFPPGTSAKAVLDEYMSTADYDGATAEFVVTAEIDGQIATTTVKAFG
ncbi:MAG: hypothetical protein WBY94_19735 [Polyangiaceae bacterium]